MTDKNQTSSGHKQAAVSNGTEEAYPKATDREAKLQQTCKRPGSTPNWTTSVQPALGGTEVEKGTVQSQKNELSYIIESDTGGVYQRNRVHIRPTCIWNVPGPDE